MSVVSAKPVLLMAVPPIHAVPPAKGAAVEWWVYQVCRQLSADYECHVACIHQPGLRDYEVLDGVHIHRIRIGRLYKRLFQKWTRWDPYSYAHRIAELARRQGAGIVHVHNAVDLLLKLHTLLHGGSQRWYLHLHNEKKLAALPEDVILLTPSQSLAGFFASKLPAMQARAVVPNGVDVAAMQQAVAAADIRGFAAGRKVVLYVGRMSPEKGPLLLIEALTPLLAREDWCLVLVGEMSAGGERCERTRYSEAMLAALSAWPAGRYLLPGACSHQAMPAIFQAADVVAIPSQCAEAFCMVAIEAMACGKTVLASRSGGMREYLRHGENGWLVDDFTQSVAWRTQLTSLLDAATADRLAQQALQTVTAAYTWQAVADALRTVYRNGE